MWCAAGDDGACRAVPELHHLLFLCLLCAEEEEAAGGVVVADAPRRARFRRELAALAEGASELRAERGVDLGALCRERGRARLFAALDAQLRRARARIGAQRLGRCCSPASTRRISMEKAADLEPRVEARRAAAAVNEDDDVGRASSAARSYRAQSSEGPPLAPPPLPAGLAAAPDGGEDGFARPRANERRRRRRRRHSKGSSDGRRAARRRCSHSSGAPAKSLEARCRILIALLPSLHAALSYEDAPLRALLEAPPTLEEASS